MSTSPVDIYSIIDRKAKQAADAWLKEMAPAMENAAKQWLSRREFSTEEGLTYFNIVHPILLWRFYFHASCIFLAAAEGWEQVYKEATVERRT